jgi:hypothetical protein
MKRKYKYQLIKSNYTYTITELAELLNAHPRTIQAFIRLEGLKVIDKNANKFLIKGRDAKEFLEKRIKTQRTKLEFYQFNCMKCRKSVESVPKEIKFIQINKKLGENAMKVDIRGVCVHCGCKLYRLSSDVKCKQLKAYYEQKTKIITTASGQVRMELIYD